MNKKQLMFALLAGIACMPSVQAMGEGSGSEGLADQVSSRKPSALEQAQELATEAAYTGRDQVGQLAGQAQLRAQKFANEWKKYLDLSGEPQGQNRTLKGDYANAMEKRYSFTPRQLADQAREAAAARAESVKNNVEGLPQDLARLGQDAQAYVRSWREVPRTDNASRNNWTETPVPVALALGSTIALDRALALLGKAFPNLFSTGDEYRKNGVLGLSLLGTGAYGSRLDEDSEADQKVFALSSLLGATTLIINAMRRWLRDAQPGEKMPTYMQEVKHALKVALLHYFNMHVAKNLRGGAGGRSDSQSQ
jgi:hypothetical protein